MTISARILLDSVNPEGIRLVTWELTYPRFIHSEFMTHRTFSRNAASSRAIPVEKLMAAVKENPAMPVWWGKNQAGMQAKEELDEQAKMAAQSRWLLARDEALRFAALLQETGLHKQIANRILEPWMHITVIASATDHRNFFKLRAHPDAQPEFQALAYKMKELYDSHEPQKLGTGEWHIPLVGEEDAQALFDDGRLTKNEGLLRLSVARCARVSYVRQHDKKTIEEDLALHDRLAASGHWSPFEHQAQALYHKTHTGNFRGFRQYRHTFANEGRETS